MAQVSEDELLARLARLEGSIHAQQAAASEASTQSKFAKMEQDLKANVDAKKAKLRQAKEDMDVDAELAANEELTQAQYKLLRFGEYRDSEASRAKAQADASASQTDDDNFARWEKKNTWFSSNPALRQEALDHHQDIISEGDIVPASRAYFNEIDRRMRAAHPELANMDGQGSGDVSSDTGGERQTSDQRARSNNERIEVPKEVVSSLLAMNIPKEEIPDLYRQARDKGLIKGTKEAARG